MRSADHLGSCVPRFFVASVMAMGCAATSGAADRDEFRLQTAPVSYVGVTDTLPVDSATESLISGYRDQLIVEMSRVIGIATAQIDEAQPEGALGNLVADAMLSAIQTLVDDTVHIAVTNNGGIRVPIREGAITVGEIFEVAPFENFLAVVNLSGAELQALADDIAQAGGEPIAGFNFHIDGATGKAGGVRVGNEPLRAGGTYRLVTLDYLLDGGDTMRTLWAARPRVTTNLTLRDAIVQFIERQDELRPLLEDRIIRVAR